MRAASNDPPRRGLAVGLVVALVLLTGCAAFPYVGPTCGPGGTDIGAIEGNVSDVEIKGELAAVNETTLVIDDKTGQAVVYSMDDVSGEVSPGDCVIARGGVAQETDDGEYEAVMVPEVLLKEEWVVEDEA